MDIDIKQLSALLKLCRKQGVTELKLNGVEFKLGDLTNDNHSQQDIQDEIPTDNPYANFPSRILSDTELAFLSAGGDPSQFQDEQ